jgi:hypothetical protein
MTTLHRNRQWKIQVFGREHGMPLNPKKRP